MVATLTAGSTRAGATPPQTISLDERIGKVSDEA